MVVLSEREVRKLKVGDEVVYRERWGELSAFIYRAKVIEILPYYIRLSCAATKDFETAYEDAESYFLTSFAYTDCASDYTLCRLYKEDK